MIRICILLLLISFVNLAHAMNQLTILLDWFPNPSHAPLFVADQQGYFKDEHLTLTIIGPADPADPPKLVAAGKADIAITYQPQFMEQIDHGLPLVRIGTLIDKPLNCLVVLKNGPIHSIKDLKGKRVGYSGSGINNSTLSTMLKSAGLTLNDIELITVHYDLTQALLAKKIDAATGLMRNFELIQLRLAGQEAKAFYPENYIPTYSELILVVAKTKSHDPRLPRFLRALTKGINYLKQHPEESWLQFAKNHPELNNELNHQAWMATLPYFSTNPAAFNEKQWLQFARFLHENGLIKEVKNISEYAIKE